MKKLLLMLMLLCSHMLKAQQFVSNPFFGNGGLVASPTLMGGEETTDFLIQPDGKIIHCGYVYDIGVNAFRINMLRVDVCGNVDSTFGTNGAVNMTFDQRNSGLDYHLQPDGKIMVVGTQALNNNGSEQKPFIARFFNNGQPDTTFGTMGTNKVLGYPTYSSFTYVLPVDNGRYLAQNGNVIMRFDSLGAIDLTFGSNGLIGHTTPPFVNFVYTWRSVQRSDKKIISVGAAYLGIANDKSPLFMCTDTLGQLDSTFGNNGFVADLNLASQDGKPFFMALQSDDKILAAYHNSSESDVNVARYNTNGSIDTTYGTNGYVSFPGSAPFRLKYIDIMSNDALITLAHPSGNPPVITTIDATGVISNSVTINGSTNLVVANTPPSGFHVLNDNEIYFATISNCCGSNWTILHTTTIPAPSVTQNVAVLNANYNQAGATYQWYLNGNIITGATDSVYTFTQNGLYSVNVVNAQGCNYSYNYTVTNTGINDATTLNDITVAPNPFNHVISIANSNSKHIQVTLTDIAGSIVYTTNTSDVKHQIQVNNMAAGVYFLTINAGNDSKRIKLVKQ